MNNRTGRIRYLLVCCLLAGGCQGGASSAPVDNPDLGGSLPSAVGQLTAGPERGLRVATTAQLAFRPSGSGFAAGYRSHDTAVADGIVTFTPYTFPRNVRTAHAPLTLETTRIAIDDDQVAGTAISTDLEPTGDVVIDRGGIEERLRNDPTGLHQEWSFPTATRVPPATSSWS